MFQKKKVVNGRRELAIPPFSRQEMCLGILIELWVDGKTLQVSCVELTGKNKSFAKEETF